MATINENEVTYDNTPNGLAERAMSYAKREVPGTLKVLEILGHESTYEEVLTATFEIKHQAVLAKQATFGDKKSIADKIIADKLAKN